MSSTSFSCKNLTKLELSQQIFGKYSNIKIHENSSNESRVVLRGQTDGQTDVTKLLVACHNFANAPKNVYTRRSSCKVPAILVII
jgi:hypothetical protein